MVRKTRITKKPKSRIIFKNVFKFISSVILLLVLLVFMITRLISQQKTLSQQEKDMKYYLAQKLQLEEENKELKNKFEKIDSEEYIESIAREKLNMYYPNERLYLDASSVI